MTHREPSLIPLLRPSVPLAAIRRRLVDLARAIEAEAAEREEAGEEDEPLAAWAREAREVEAMVGKFVEGERRKRAVAKR